MLSNFVSVQSILFNIFRSLKILQDSPGFSRILQVSPRLSGIFRDFQGFEFLIR